MGVVLFAVVFVSLVGCAFSARFNGTCSVRLIHHLQEDGTQYTDVHCHDFASGTDYELVGHSAKRKLIDRHLDSIMNEKVHLSVRDAPVDSDNGIVLFEEDPNFEFLIEEKGGQGRRVLAASTACQYKFINQARKMLVYNIKSADSPDGITQSDLKTLLETQVLPKLQKTTYGTVKVQLVGVYTVTVPINVKGTCDGNLLTEAERIVKEKFGVDRASTGATTVAYVRPPGMTCPSYAAANSPNLGNGFAKQWYSAGASTRVNVWLHEMGHAIQGMGHSAVYNTDAFVSGEEKTYGDRSCIMGSGPAWNIPHSWYMGFLGNQRKSLVETGGRSQEHVLTSVTRFQQGANKMHVIELVPRSIVPPFSATSTFYVGFSGKDGFQNELNADFTNKVTIHEWRDPRVSPGRTYALKQLGAGESFNIGSPTRYTVTVKSIDTGSMSARVLITEGGNPTNPTPPPVTRPPTTKPPTPKPTPSGGGSGGNCKDKGGVVLKGQEMTCSELVQKGLCATHSKVRRRCKLSCGRCGGGGSTDGECTDVEGLFYVGKKQASCEKLKKKWCNRPRFKFVQEACEKSCGKCEANRAGDDRMEARTLVDEDMDQEIPLDDDGNMAVIGAVGGVLAVGSAFAVFKVMQKRKANQQAAGTATTSHKNAIVVNVKPLSTLNPAHNKSRKNNKPSGSRSNKPPAVAREARPSTSRSQKTIQVAKDSGKARPSTRDGRGKR